MRARHGRNGRGGWCWWDRSRPPGDYCRRRMPISEIAGERAGQQPIDRACAAAQRLLCRPDQDKGQTLLDRLEVGP